MCGVDGRAARDRQKLRRQLTHESADLAFQIADLDGELADPGQLGQGDTTPGALRQGFEDALEPVQPHVAVEHPGWQLEVDPEVVAVPPETLDDASALLDEVVAVIDEEAHVMFWTAQRGLRQSGLAQCGSRHTGGVDRI